MSLIRTATAPLRPRLFALSLGLRGFASTSRAQQAPAAAPASVAAAKPCCSKTKAAAAAPTPTPLSPLTASFWSSRPTWSRAAVNTFRCLIGCSLGDLSTMWYLMAYYPDMPMSTSMGLSMAAGITTSILLETTLLHIGKDKLSWPAAAKTAFGMSFISMLAMESAENAVTLALADVNMTGAAFAGVTAAGMLAGFLTPMPYNYWRLRALGKACH
ncbi:uncharacterized protein LOC62_03G004175 [Vanrija pseudolonga]|uniref:DUF4396 domain-containing protein n=1 Tax=Vanrija pseudolonga TaxID=143232 RepID=A0AAF1BH47_9TREE|nr:hypothetical protein LOC62_03G004175 [Vanrija pseudolonga]